MAGRLVFTGVIGQRHGDRFVYSATDPHPGQRPFTSTLWLMRAEGGGDRLLHGHRHQRGAANWRGQSAYAAELYLMHPDGSARARLTRTGTVGEASPSWSPDGAWITYARTGPEDFTSSVFVMRSDGTCQTAVLPTAGRRSYSAPAWRPHSGGVKPPAC